MADPRKINLADVQGPVAAADGTAKAAFRTDLGLGDAATLDVGTGAGTVAAGDHNHSGVYQPADADLTALAEPGSITAEEEPEAGDKIVTVVGGAFRLVDWGDLPEPGGGEANPTQVSSGEIEAGDGTSIRSWAPADVVATINEHAPAAGDGDVTGPEGGVTDGQIAGFDGETGKAIKGLTLTPSPMFVHGEAEPPDTYVPDFTAAHLVWMQHDEATVISVLHDIDPSLGTDPVTTTSGETYVIVDVTGHEMETALLDGTIEAGRPVLLDLTPLDGIETGYGQFTAVEDLGNKLVRIEMHQTASGTTAGGGGSSVFLSIFIYVPPRGGVIWNVQDDTGYALTIDAAGGVVRTVGEAGNDVAESQQVITILGGWNPFLNAPSYVAAFEPVPSE